MTDAALLGYVAQRTGMRVAGAQQRRLVRLLDRAQQESGLTAGAFTELLRREPTAFDALVDDLTVGETYFFRERPQLELARDAVLAQSPRGKAGVRVWSAGCSTGEEAYTLSMLLGAGAGEGVQVLGTDISRAALARAERATYGERSVRTVADAERSRWFETVRRRAVRVRDGVRGSVRFQPANLLDAPPAMMAFDLVLCRNVLIYLSPEGVAQVAANLRDALAPTGWLVTGVADPVLEAAGLERVSTRQGALYRRSSARTPAAHRRATVTPTVATRLEQTPTPLPPPSARAARLDAVALPDLRHAARARPAAAAERAATGGETGVAGAQAAVDAAPLDPSLRYRLALLHLEQGDLRSASTAASAAVFLEPTFIVAHLLLGRVFEGLRDQRKARRCFRTAAALLEQLPGDARVPNADGETAEALARVVGTALSVDRRGDGGGR